MNIVSNSSGNRKNDSKSFPNMPEDSDNRAQVKRLFDNLKDELPTLEKLLGQCNEHWGYEDGIYEFEQQTDKRTNKHEFVLENLKPDTEYSYEVMSQNRNYVYAGAY